MLNRLNGWQRLWVCLSGLSLLTFGLVMPWHEVVSSRNSPVRWEMRAKAELEAASGQCNDYVTKEFSSLKAPQYRLDENTCYYIYSARQFSETKGPYDREKLDAEERSKTYSEALTFMAMCSVGVLIVCGIVYLLGWLVAWVRRGFAKTV